MKRGKIIRSLRLFARDHPFLTLLFALAAIAGTLLLISRFRWGKYCVNFVATLVFSEAGALLWYEAVHSAWTVFWLLVVANAFTLLLDTFVIRQLLLMPRVKKVLDFFSVTAKRFIENVVRIVRGRRPVVQGEKSINIHEPHTWSNPIANQVKHIAGNPTKAGLGSVFALGLVPRALTGVIGGTALAVLVIKYNRFNAIGWLVLAAAMLIRIIGTIALYTIFY